MSDEYDPITTDDARLLFLAVVNQAACDACADPPTSKTRWSRRERQEVLGARGWFMSKGQDFRAVCAAANICPDRLHEDYVSGRLKRNITTRVTHKRRLSRGFDKDKKMRDKKGFSPPDQ